MAMEISMLASLFQKRNDSLLETELIFTILIVFLLLLLRYEMKKQLTYQFLVKKPSQLRHELNHEPFLPIAMNEHLGWIKNDQSETLSSISRLSYLPSSLMMKKHSIMHYFR